MMEDLLHRWTRSMCNGITTASRAQLCLLIGMLGRLAYVCILSRAQHGRHRRLVHGHA